MEELYLSTDIGPDKKEGVFGFVEKCGFDGIEGWLVDVASPDRVLELEAWLGDMLVARGKNAASRPDIEELLGKKDIRCAFRLNWSYEGLKKFFSTNGDLSSELRVCHAASPLRQRASRTAAVIAGYWEKIKNSVASPAFQVPPDAGAGSFVLEFAVRVGGRSVLAGRGSGDFKAMDPQEPQTRIESVISSKGSFLLLADSNYITDVAFELADGGIYCWRDIQYQRLDKYTSHNLWRFIKGLGEFSSAWHKALSFIPQEWLVNIDAAALDDRGKRVLHALRQLLPNFNPSGHIASIDTLVDGKVGGWVRDPASHKPVFIDLFQDGASAALNVPADILRPDLLAAGIGHGKYGFTASVPPAGDATETCVALRVAGGGPFLAFRFFDLDSDAEYSGAIKGVEPEIYGFSENAARPDAKYPLEILLDDIVFAKTANVPKSASAQTEIDEIIQPVTFRASSPLPYLRAGGFNLKLRFPDGSLSENFEFTAPGRVIPANVRMDKIGPVAVIVPFSFSVPDFSFFLENLFRHTPADTQIIFVNDHCEEDMVAALGAALGNHENARIIAHNGPRGYFHAANAGLKAAGALDAIILSPFSRPGERWLGALRRAGAESSSGVVAPLCISPAENMPPFGCGESEFCRAFRRQSLGLYPSMAAPARDCLYISHRLIQAVGGFDAENFPDMAHLELCMRAQRAGFRNILDDRTLVFIKAGKEASDEEKARFAALYPDFAICAAEYENSAAWLLAIYSLRAAAANWQMLVRPRLLYVISTNEGGTPQTNMDLMNGMAAAATCWLLRCDGAAMKLYRLNNGALEKIQEHHLREPLTVEGHVSPEYAATAEAWLDSIDIDILHCRHLLWHSLELPAIAARLGARVVFSFHDYYVLSPNLNLLDDGGAFMGNDFLAAASPYRINMWSGLSPAMKDQPVDSANYIDFWRGRFQHALEPCSAFITTSQSAASIVADAFPGLAPRVIPHGRDFKVFQNLRQNVVTGEKFRLLILGNINYPKGLGMIHALAAHDHANLNCLEFHILGGCSNPEPVPGVIYHGRYERENVADKISAIAPHAAAVFSIWNETWCHTLTELWACGLPTFVFDIGTLAERTRQSGAGWVLALDDIPAIYRKLTGILADDVERERAASAVADWQRGAGRANGVAFMRNSYYKIYREILGCEGSGKTAAFCCRPGNGSSYIRVMERCRNDFKRPLNYLSATPVQLARYLAGGDVDAAIIQRDVIPPILVDEIIAAASKNHIPLILELDDDLAATPADKDPDGHYAAYRPYLRKLIANAALVLTSTPKLARRLESLASRVVISPNALSVELWLREPEDREPDGYVRALYFGSPTHFEDLTMILPALRATASRNPDFRVCVVGIDGIDEAFLAENSFIEKMDIPDKDRPYPRFVEFLRRIAANCDFGLAPLVDTSFNATKSELKILEYAALGLPALASRAGAYGELAGFPGLELVDVSAWEEALAAKIDSGGRGGGKSARKYVLENYLWNDRRAAEFDSLILELISRQASGGERGDIAL